MWAEFAAEYWSAFDKEAETGHTFRKFIILLLFFLQQDEIKSFRFSTHSNVVFLKSNKIQSTIKN